MVQDRRPDNAATNHDGTVMRFHGINLP